MIHFKPITDYSSRILSNGKTIGTLELLANTYYLIEIDYFEFQLPVKDKRLVKGMIERVYAKGKAREFRSMKRMRNINEFKIKE